MNNSDCYRNQRLNINQNKGIYRLLLLLGICMVCMPAYGNAIPDTRVPTDTNTAIREDLTLNQSFTDVFEIDPDLDLPESHMKHRDPFFALKDMASDADTTSSIMYINDVSTATGNSGGNVTDLQLTWQKCLGGSSYDMPFQVIQTSDGGYLMGGSTDSNDGDVSGQHGWTDYWVVKLDASRTMVWQRCLGGSDDEYPTSIIQTTDGGFLVNGYTYSIDDDVTGNHGSYDIWEVKLDPAGNMVWQKCLGGTRYEHSHSVIQTTDGGYLVSGYTNSKDGDVSGNHGNYDIWEVKLNPEGDITWKKCLGGIGNERPHSVIQTTDGGYLVNGYTNSNDTNVTGNHGNWDIWEVKLNSSGDILWQKCLGGINSEYPYSAIQTTDGGYLVSGSTNSNNGNVSGNHGEVDIWEVKLDPEGDITWQKCLGGISYEEPNAGVIQTTDGGYLVSGYTDSDDTNVTGNHGGEDIWEVKLDSEGDITWKKCLGGSDYEYPEYVFQTSDGGYLIGGYTYSNDGDVSGNHGYADVWAVKLDPAGNMVWQKCLGGTSYEEPNAGIIQTTDGSYLFGGFTDSLDSDIVGSHGNVDIWLVLLTATHPVTATSDSWTIAYPPGTTSYVEGTNTTYLAQARPGADLVNVSVDDNKVGPVSNWTFSVIATNHTFATTGQATPGQVHAYFTLNTTWGAVPLTVQFNNQSLGDPTSFSWDFGDGGKSTEKDPVYTYTTPGRYSVTLRATNARTGGIATLTHALTATAGVVPSPTPTPVPGEITAAFSADPTSGSAPMQVSFIDTSTGSPTSWVWDLGDGNLSTTRNVTHIYTVKGTYSVGLTAQNSANSGSITKIGHITVT